MVCKQFCSRKGNKTAHPYANVYKLNVFPHKIRKHWKSLISFSLLVSHSLICSHTKRSTYSCNSFSKLKWKKLHQQIRSHTHRKFCILNCRAQKATRNCQQHQCQHYKHQGNGKCININGRDDVLFNFKTRTDLLNFLHACLVLKRSTEWSSSQ